MLDVFGIWKYSIAHKDYKAGKKMPRETATGKFDKTVHVLKGGVQWLVASRICDETMKHSIETISITHYP